MTKIINCSIELSAIPAECIKKVTKKDGKTAMYLNCAVIERKEVSKFGHTHFVSCAPKKEERKEGVNYLIGDGKEFVLKSFEERVQEAPAMETNPYAQPAPFPPSVDVNGTPSDDLPFN